MKAFIYEEYGTPDVLQWVELENPIPKPDEVLVKVQAISLNASDWEFLTGSPMYIRAWGLFKPKSKILGSDIVGVVESVGENVTRFQSGDVVLGDTMMQGFGGFAEYACIAEKLLCHKPSTITDEVAACLPQAATIAIQCLQQAGNLQRGQKVLINGAGGSTGHFAIHIAKHIGAEVTAVDRGDKLDYLRLVGADHVIDYQTADFSQNGERYDLIMDLVARHSGFHYRRSLTDTGQYFIVGGELGCLIKTATFGAFVSNFSKKKMGAFTHQQNVENDLLTIVDWIEKGIIRPQIHKNYTFDQVPDALRELGAGNAKGKIVITL